MTDGDCFRDLGEPFAEDRQSDEDRHSDDESGASAPAVEVPLAERPGTEVAEPSSPSTRTAELQARAAEVDPEFKLLFWKLVLLYKLGVVGLSLGVMLWAFTPHPTHGSALTAGGVAVLAYAAVRTYRGKARLDAGGFDLGSEGSDLDSEGSTLDSEGATLDTDEPAEGPSR